MAILKSRTVFPPGGWVFQQPQTGWASNPWVGFDQVVEQIIEHRKSNPRFNLPTQVNIVAFELEQFTVKRMASIKGGNNYIIGDQQADPPPPKRKPPQKDDVVAGAKKTVETVAQNIGKYVNNTVAGISLYVEWFGDKPVPLELAESRASICLGCPKHVSGNIFQRFNQIASREIMAVFGTLKKMNLKTSKDAQLGACDVCDCPMQAKVWSPRQIILNHLKPERFEELPPHCWIKTEQE